MTTPEGLRAKAEAATPGPWTPCGENRGGCQCRFVYAEHDVVAKAMSSADNDGEGYSEEQAKRNAFYMAAANPATVLALLDERDALLAEVQASRAAQRAIAEALGMVHEPSMGPTWPASWEELVDRVSANVAEVAAVKSDERAAVMKAKVYGEMAHKWKRRCVDAGLATESERILADEWQERERELAALRVEVAALRGAGRWIPCANAPAHSRTVAIKYGKGSQIATGFHTPSEGGQWLRFASAGLCGPLPGDIADAWYFELPASPEPAK